MTVAISTRRLARIPGSGPGAGRATFTTQPRRDTSRDSSSDRSAPSCPVCSGPLSSSRARYCSPAHRQRAFRLRHVQLATLDEPQLRAELRRLYSSSS